MTASQRALHCFSWSQLRFGRASFTSLASCRGSRSGAMGSWQHVGKSAASLVARRNLPLNFASASAVAKRWNSTPAKPAAAPKTSSSSSGKRNEDWCAPLPNSRTGKQAYIIGVEYNSATNSEKVYEVMNELGPDTLVLMESYNCPIEEDIASGQVVPYRRVISEKSIKKATERLKDPAFRGRLSGEVLAVLHSFEMRDDILFCDRNHILSVDRIVNRYGLQELEQRCTEGFKASLQAAKRGHIPLVFAQNTLLPAFEELLYERHVVMAHCARVATRSRNVVVVVGGQHVAGVKEVWSAFEASAASEKLSSNASPTTSTSSSTLTSSSSKLDLSEIQELLSVSPLATGTDSWERQLQKRALLLALFITTSAFPPETVTASIAEVNDADTEAVKSHYRTYRAQFQRYMDQTSVTTQDMNKILSQSTEVQGLPQLFKLIEYYDSLVE